MTQDSLFDLSPPAPAPQAWLRVPGIAVLGSKGVTHVHVASGIQIHHCGHPTANFPYYIVTPAGERVLAPNGRGFQRLDLAKHHVESQLI